MFNVIKHNYGHDSLYVSLFLILSAILTIFIIYIQSNLHKVGYKKTKFITNIVIIKLLLAVTIFILPNTYVEVVLDYISDFLLVIGYTRILDAQLTIGHQVGSQYYYPVNLDELSGPNGKAYLSDQLSGFREWYYANVSHDRTNNRSPRITELYFTSAEAEQRARSMIGDTEYYRMKSDNGKRSLRVTDQLIHELGGTRESWTFWLNGR